MIINSHAQLSNLVEVKKRIQEKYEVFALKKYLIDRALLSWVIDLSFVISIANINVKFVGYCLKKSKSLLFMKDLVFTINNKLGLIMIY